MTCLRRAAALVALSYLTIASACPVIVDVRTQEEWDAGHLPCAHLLPVQDDTTLGTALECLAGGKAASAVKLYCRSGNRAGVALNILRDQGFANVTNEGGYVDLKSAGLCDCAPQNRCDEAPSPGSGTDKDASARLRSHSSVLIAVALAWLWVAT